jgi:hypothetical protein
LALTVWAVAIGASAGLGGLAHADPSTCDPGALAVAAESASPGVGHRGIYLNFTLQSGAGSCQLSGYPTVDVDPNLAGTAPIRAKQTPGGYLGGATPDTTVTLQPGHGARAMVEWVAAPGGQDPACRIYGATPPEMTVHATAPGTSQSFSVPLQVGRNEGLCNLQVHPLTGA